MPWIIDKPFKQKHTYTDDLDGTVKEYHFYPNVYKDKKTGRWRLSPYWFKHVNYDKYNRQMQNWYWQIEHDDMAAWKEGKTA